MKPRVLVAIADRGPWTGHRAALSGDADVVFVESAREALDRLAHQGPFAALVAELHVLGMSGVDLLAAARQHFPDTARLLVVDGEDREAAIVAINEARVHAFFVHPFSSKVFADAVWLGVTEFHKARHEHAVLVQATEGIVQLLSGLVHPAIPIPPISEAAEQMRTRVVATAAALRLLPVADLATAALLSRVALAGVPRHILDKLLTHDRLAPAEAELVARMPDVGLRLVEHQPRFAGVAEIFRHQGVDPGPMTVREDGLRECKVPLASRILRVIVDLQMHENAGLTLAAALAVMRRQTVHYDSTVLKAVELLFAGPGLAANASFEECMIEDLMPGVTLGADALSTDGVPLVATGTEITSTVLNRLRNFADLGEVVEPLYIIRPAEQQTVDAAAPEAEPAPETDAATDEASGEK